MKKVFIDEYLTDKLRQRIDKLVDLNLDLESILSLLSNDLYGYADYMVEEIQRYVKYVVWLRDHYKSRNFAFEKYKKQTKQDQKATEILSSNSLKNKNHQNHLANEVFLTQLRKERKRIDEISNLHYETKAAEKIQEEIETDNLDNLNLNNPVDEILESLSDEEIQATLSEFLTTDVDSKPLTKTDLELEESMENSDGEEKKEPKKEVPILDEPSHDQNPKSLIEKTNKITDLTFDDILIDDSPTILNSDSEHTLFDFDYLDDNGTETLNDSILLEKAELNLQSLPLENSEAEIDSEFSDIQQLSESVEQTIKIDEINTENLETKTEELETKLDLIDDETLEIEDEDESEKLELESDEIELELELDEDDEIEFEQTQEEILDENEELTSSEQTNQALNFLDELEEKYGDQTLITLNAEKHDLQTTNFTLADPTSTLKIGVHVHYQDSDYVVENIEIELDFFHHQQTIVTLIDPENHEKIKINAKKIK